MGNAIVPAGGSMSPLSYLRDIDNQSFEQCVNFARQQLQAVGVSTSGTNDVGQMLAEWAHHLAGEANFSQELLNHAIVCFKANQDPHKAISALDKFHAVLSGKKSILDFAKFTGKDTGRIASAITSHPFYPRFQKSGVEASITYVHQAYDVYKQVDAIFKRTGSRMESIRDELERMSDPTLGISDVFIPTDVSSKEAVLASIGKTIELLHTKPVMLYSANAAAALSDIVAKEIYVQRQQALLILDATCMRYYTIAYFGVLMDSALKLFSAHEASASLVKASGQEVKQLMETINKLRR